MPFRKATPSPCFVVEVDLGTIPPPVASTPAEPLAVNWPSHCVCCGEETISRRPMKYAVGDTRLKWDVGYCERCKAHSVSFENWTVAAWAGVALAAIAAFFAVFEYVRTRGIAHHILSPAQYLHVVPCVALLVAFVYAAVSFFRNASDADKSKGVRCAASGQAVPTYVFTGDNSMAVRFVNEEFAAAFRAANKCKPPLPVPADVACTVVTTTPEIRTPNVCVCCRGAADQTKTWVRGTAMDRSGGGSTRIVNLTFPMCSACERHGWEAKIGAIISILRVLFLSAVVVYGILGRFLTSWWAFLPISALGIAGLTAGVFSLVRIGRLSGAHALRTGAPVSAVPEWPAPNIRLRFANTRYAVDFAALNPGSILTAEKHRTEPYRGTRLAGHAGMRSAVIVMIALIGCQMLEGNAGDNPWQASAPHFIPAGPTKVNPKDGAAMIYIPPGPFLMGDSDEDDNPRHTVTLSGYYIYKNDVTVAMYRKFCTATGRTMPDLSDDPRSGDDHPIVDVRWDDAQAYCDWAGAQLPTEAQWEKAARGTDGRMYPWGNDWDGAKCANSVDSNHAGGTAPVGSFPAGASPYGVMDMAGNVSDWCADWYDEDYWKTDDGPDPTGPSSGDPSSGGQRVLRGGGWDEDYAVTFRAANRSYDAPTVTLNYNGFRCVVRPGSY